LAAVKANFLWPNSSDAATVGAIAAMFTQTYYRSRLRSWMVRVTRNLLTKDDILREEHCANGGLNAVRLQRSRGFQW
jgi:hypothetical protein